MILPLDAHAHIEPGIAPAELAALCSCVIAVTRTLDEYAQTRDRPDRCVVWGAGCHPGMAMEVKGFSASRLRNARRDPALVARLTSGNRGCRGSRRLLLRERITSRILEEPAAGTGRPAPPKDRSPLR